MSGNRVAGSPGCHAPQRVARPSLCPKHPGIAVVALPGCPWSVTIRRGAGKQKSLLQHGAPQTGFFYSYSRKCCKRWRVIRAEIAIRGEPVGLEIYEKLFSAVAAAMKPCRWGAALVIHSMRVQAVTPDGAGGVQAQQMRCRSSQPVQAPHRWRDTWRGADWPSASALGWRLGANARPLSSQGQPVGTVQAVSWEDFHSCQRSIYLR